MATPVRETNSRHNKDVESNIQATKYSIRELVQRVFWAIGLWIFRWTPRPCFGMRRGLLRLFGARVGKRVRTYASTHIYFPWNLQVGDYSSFGEDVLIYNLGLVTIGDRVTISQRAHVCAGTHDYREPSMPLLKLPIRIENDVWICADAFVGPGVVICNGAIAGARAVVVKDIGPSEIVAGNPARFIKMRDSFRSEEQSD
ncbi:MAG: colanic acid biosynthesis acetyltransferase WcaF [Pirellula sp.]